MLFLFPRFPASPPASRRDGPVEDCSRQMPEAVGHPQQRKVFLLVPEFPRGGVGDPVPRTAGAGYRGEVMVHDAS